MTRARWTLLLLLVAPLGASACDADGGAAPAAPAWCDEAPVTTWHNFGEGFLRESCQPCHASGAVDRHDAPGDVVFDTPEDVRRLRERVLSAATGFAPTMPPAGGVPGEARARLEVWLTCDHDPLLRGD